MADFAVGDVQLPADFEQQIASQLAANGYNFAVQPPTGQTPAPPATAASAPQFEVAAGGEPAYNPDFAVSGKIGRVSERGMGANPEDPYSAAGVPVGTFATFGNTGIPYGENNGRYFFGNDTMSAPEFEALKAGAQSRSDPLFSAKPTEIAPGVTYNPAGQTDPSTPTITTTSSAPFDYSTLRAGEPQLQPASGQYATPYYAAYTNDGGFAGAVMVAPGQKIRMIDPTNGHVVFESEGPEGAKQAVALANSLSQEKGRKAAWQIQAENEQGGYTTQAAERYDPKKQSFIGKLADFVLPMVGAYLGGPIGAALASAGSSAAQGRSLQETALRAALTAGFTYAGDKVGPLISQSFNRGAANAAANAATNTATNTATNVAANAGASGLGGGIVDAASGIIMDSAGRVFGLGAQQLAAVASAVAAKGAPAVLEELVVTGVPRAVAQQMVAAAVARTAGAGAGALTSGALASGSGGSPPAQQPPAQQPPAQQQPPAASTTQITDPAQVDEIVVTALKKNANLTADELVRLHPEVPEALLRKAMVDMVTSTAKTTSQTNTNAAAGAATGAAAGSLLDAIKSGDPEQIKQWAKDHPLDAASTALSVAGLFGAGGGSGGGGGGSYSIPTGAGAPGTRGSLSPLYTASLPAPSSRFAARQPNNMAGVDWKRYGMGPERSFFSVVPQSTPVSDLSGGPASSSAAAGTTAGAGYPAFAVVQNRLAMDSGRGPAPEGKRYIQRDDGVILLVDDSPEATYTGRSGATKKVRDLSVYQGGFTTKPISDFAAANLPEVIANLRKVGGLPMRRGGFAVQGDGDGREDAIPAQLSDGEYVIDAETVALLGNGSSKAGAAKLDKFRVNVRKHKGRELAKGKFSANAKDPTAYLAGGRS